MCDPDDAANFRCSRTEIWGTFPFEVPIPKNTQNLDHLVAMEENSCCPTWDASASAAQQERDGDAHVVGRESQPVLI